MSLRLAVRFSIEKVQSVLLFPSALKDGQHTTAIVGFIAVTHCNILMSASPLEPSIEPSQSEQRHPIYSLLLTEIIVL